MAATRAPAPSAKAETELVTNLSGGRRHVEASFSTKKVSVKRKNAQNEPVIVEVERPVVYDFAPGETKEVPAGDLDHLFGENGQSKTFSVKTSKLEAEKKPAFKKAKK